MAEKNQAINELFGQKTVKTMALFLANPNASFYQSQAAQFLKEPITSLQYQLSKLVKVGFLKTSQNKYKTEYSLNLEFPFYTEIKLMVGGETTNYMGIGNVINEGKRAEEKKVAPKPKKRAIIKKFTIKKPSFIPKPEVVKIKQEEVKKSSAESVSKKKINAESIFKGLFE